MARTQLTPEPQRPNHYEYREQWLAAALSELRPWFGDRGHPLPFRVRMAIGFTGQGRTGTARGQTWNAAASGGETYEIFIRPDLADPVTVLTVLVTQLISTVLPADAGRGPKYRTLAGVIGLLPPMRDPQASVSLRERLNALAATLGPLPHQALDLDWRAVNAPPKQGTRMVLFACPVCAFPLRFAKTWMTTSGPPLCARDRVAFELQESLVPAAKRTPPHDLGAGATQSPRRAASKGRSQAGGAALPAGELLPPEPPCPVAPADIQPQPGETRTPESLPPSGPADGEQMHAPGKRAQSFQPAIPGTPMAGDTPVGADHRRAGSADRIDTSGQLL